MTYCTQQHLVDRFGEKMIRALTDRATPPANAIVTAVVDRALADTDAAIDGYLLGRYVLPITTAVPDLLRDIAIAIAIYKLHGQAVSEKIKADHDQARRDLREIASGVIRLNVAGVEPAGSGASGVRTTDRERDMTPENMKGFV